MWGAAFAAVMVAGGCSGGGDDLDRSAVPDGDALRPTYPVVEEDDGQPTGSDAGETETTAAPADDGDAPGPAPPTGSAPGDSAPGDRGAPPQVDAVPTTSSTTDPVGDPTIAVAGDRPPWADLAGGTLSIAGDGAELRVRLADQVPEAAPDDDHTMNVASFFDVDGDGTVDYEIWLNLGDGGWGPGYFGPTGARYGDDAGVQVTVDADELVVRFPLSHLGGARQLRWSLASEWGRYDAIGTAAMARDDAPDGDRPVSHPS